MKKIISIIFIFFIYQLNILAGFGIQIGSYSSRPNIPAQLKQLNLPSQIIQEGNAFKLFVGPFNTRAQATQVQSNFNIQGNIVEYGNNTPRGGNQNTQQNQSFAIEILCSRDINSVPRRIVNQAFSSGLPGNWGNIIVSSSAVTFGFSSILAWEYYGEKCFEYLFKEKWIGLYRYAWVLFVFMGALFELEIVWNFSDAMNALMAVPNLIGLLLLSKILTRETRSFEEGINKGTINKFD